MTLTPEGGAAIPVSVTTTRKVQGGAAIPVYGYMTAPTDGRPAMGGAAIPVRVLTAADLKQNGGQWTLEGRPHAMPVYTAPAGATVMGGPALAVYPVNAWPTVPVVPAFVPTDYVGLALWLKAYAGLFKDAAKAQPANVDGDAVYTWADQSGNGRDAIQATLAARPFYKVSIQNGKPMVLSDGIDDLLATGAFARNQPRTIYCVIKVATITNSWWFEDNNADALGVRQEGAGIVRAYSGATLDVTKTLGTTNAWIVTTVFNGASSSIKINNEAAVSGDAGAVNSAGGFRIFGGWWPGIFSAIYAGEYLDYAGAHTAGQVANVLSYLNTQWAVY